MLPIYKKLQKIAEQYDKYKQIVTGLPISRTLSGNAIPIGANSFKMSKNKDEIRFKAFLNEKKDKKTLSKNTFILTVTPNKVDIETSEKEWKAEKVMEVISSADARLNYILQDKIEAHSYKMKELKKLAQMKIDV